MDTPTVIKTLKVLEKHVAQFRVPVMDLHETHEDEPFRVLVGTLLSAQTKDQVTAAACKRLFRKVKGFEDLRSIDETELQKLIYPVSFYYTKAKHLKEMGVLMKKAFQDVIPQSIDELVTLPGVGRKTANLVMIIAFKQDAICVDTHVHRIFNIFCYIRTKNPSETELRLREKLPREWWARSNKILVSHGQHTCTSVSPWCSKCPVRALCERRGVKRSR